MIVSGFFTSPYDHSRIFSGDAIGAFEQEADLLGLQYMYKAGYDPNAAASLWKKMEKAGGNGPPQFLSTHPSPANRQQTLAALAPQMMAYYKAPGERPVYQLAGAPTRKADAPKATAR